MSRPHLGARPQIAAERETVVPRQHQIENDDVDPSRLQRGPHALAVADRGHAIAVLLQVFAQQAADFGVVVDDEYVIGGRHGLCISRYRAAVNGKIVSQCNNPVP